MNWFASELTSACSTELAQNNLMVSQTLLALKSYGLLRAGACLPNQQSGTYCYAEAAHDASPAGLYLYQLPLGIGFPTGTTGMSCTTCSKSLLALYADALKNGSATGGFDGDGDGGDGGGGSKGGDDAGTGLEGLQRTYEDAAGEAESTCGTGFASVGLATKGGASGAAGRFGLGLWSGRDGRGVQGGVCVLVWVMGVSTGLLVGL